MEKIQEKFNSSSDADFVLMPGEYEGPLVVGRPCVIDGRQSTLWANSGPVLIVSAPNVTLKNLRVEVTGDYKDQESGIAIKSDAVGTKLENIEVHGRVVGIPGEEESWDLPSVISLGEFAADRKNTFTVNVKAADSAALVSQVEDLHIFPNQLVYGQNKLTLTTSELRNNTIIYGEITVRTSVLRRICVTGKALSGAPAHDEAAPAESLPVESLHGHVEPPPEIIAPEVSGQIVNFLKRGQRISANQLHSSLVKIVYDHKSAPPKIDIDSYTFLLKDNGKVSCDEDLIFFGNNEAKNHSIKSSPVDGMLMVSVDLDKVDAAVGKIDICYSIYGDNPLENFSLVSKPVIRIFGGDTEAFRFPLEDLKEEKTVVAVELYRYKGEWKINCIGAGFKSGLRQLCEVYGVDVE